MNKKIIFLVLSLLTSFTLLKLTSSEVIASDVLNTSENTTYTHSDAVVSQKFDKRAYILEKYLAQFNSPMQYHAQDFIDAADAYKLDWKLLPSIAGVESTFGKHIPGGYNAYGWGVYGDNRIYFKSWRDGMFVLAQGLREKYLNKGLTDPYLMNRVYAASPTWGSKVTFFMNEIEEFAKTEGSIAVDPIAEIKKDPYIAAISGQVANPN